jgi:hypothetical protein
VGEIVLPKAPVRIGLTYSPSGHRVAATIDDREVVSVAASLIVTAPAQVEIGQNHSDVGLSYPMFTGKIRTIQRSIR